MTGERVDGANRGPSIVIIGAGISGMLMGIKLLERGRRDFVLLEKGETLGGTWRDNTYPGVACDVAAHLYTYSFARNPWWKTRYAKGRDIWSYYRRVAQKSGLLPFIRYRQEVDTAAFADDRWTVTTRAGEVYHADIVIAANGRLHHPMLPQLPGIETFGNAFHSSRWNHMIDTTGKRVGVIGTGSTATQIVNALARRVRRLSVFQRTPQWVYPVKDTPNPWWQRIAFGLSGKRWVRYYNQLRDETEARGRATTGSAEARKARDQVCHDALAAIGDPELRRKLTPDYEVGCKRLVFSDGFYDAIQQPSIDLVTERITSIVPEGVMTRDGFLHELDVLVFATGFDAHAYLHPMKITGENGITLDAMWRDLPVNYQSMTIPHMPNFMMINGPYSPGGSASVVGIVEAQVDYLLKLIGRIAANDVLLAPREDVAVAWLDDVRDQARQSVWATGGCQSWYLDKTGVPTLNPTTLSDLQVALREPVYADYVERPRGTRPVAGAA